MTDPAKILIIDDETDICYFLTTSLARRGFVTSFSNSLQEAESKLKKETPSIILLDNHLPDGRGVDFIPFIFKHCPDTKVIMITAHDSASDRQKAYQNGIHFFLPKPFSMAAVNQAIDKVVGE